MCTCRSLGADGLEKDEKVEPSKPGGASRVAAAYMQAAVRLRVRRAPVTVKAESSFQQIEAKSTVFRKFLATLNGSPLLLRATNSLPWVGG